nr:hypothetical protein [Sphingomonas bacterium]
MHHRNEACGALALGLAAKQSVAWLETRAKSFFDTAPKADGTARPGAA